ncbi:ImmA/IrrE family metallo-endopeptidase [Roseburia sp. 1XD42-34]|nr:ImmA/IrrE family metallo-endopeptidase [Roseburia sp. 1XD42-34]NBJ71011.1 ImmA/IrrE family metallo-endopeptidase [Roseburia sp. 1XD42-34]RKI75474.1 ImmA/IrrE family metallo-endopeptidase [Clostridium sp. 1xD42-85]
MDIVVRTIPLGKILGFHTRHARVSIIHINENASTEQQIFTCAHELAHAILHPEINTPFLKFNTYYSTSKIEVEANTFAIKLVFRKDMTSTITIKDAVENYGIPEQLLIKNFYD